MYFDVVLNVYLGKSLDNIPVIVADISDDASLNNMCQKAKVILNCVGPVRNKS